jgi:type IV pilus assembly protein PilW
MAMTAHKHSGMTLIELMVALAIGAFLMIGAITVFMQSRTAFRVTESLARLQENGRFALDVLEADIRMAHYWGLNTVTSTVVNRAGPTAANGVGTDVCGVNWTINLDQAVEGSNNSYPWICAGTAPVEVNADTLVVRRASEDPVVPVVGGLHLQSVRGTGDSRIFVGTAIPAGYSAATSQTHRLLVNGYYVSRTSVASVGANLVPSLRRQTLRQDGTMAPSGGEEVVAGIEDMQLQFGVDTNLPGQPNRGSIDRYVNPGDPMITPGAAGFDPNAEILSVRIWLLVRAERIELGLQDPTVYQYADQNRGPFNDGFRRLLVSKTIYLRNARPNS